MTHRLLIMATVAGATAAVAAPAGAQEPAGQIVFQRDTSVGSQIWIMNGDGSGQRQLTTGKGPNATPAWTPDGRIVFASGRNGNWELYETDAAGSQAVRLTRTASDEFDPVVCGSTIAYEGNAAGDWDIYAMPAQGGKPANLSRDAQDDFDPTCSPDDQQIAFATATRKDSDVEKIPVNGAGRPQPVAPGPERDSDAQWSQDDQIVFSRRSGLTRDVFVMQSDGSDVRQVTRGGTDDSSPAPTDDGRVVFVRALKPGAPFGVYVANLDGSGQQLLATGATEPALEPASASAGAVLRSPLAQLSSCRNGTSHADTLGIVGSVRTCSYGHAAADTFSASDGRYDYVNGESGADQAYADDDGIDVVKSATAH